MNKLIRLSIGISLMAITGSYLTCSDQTERDGCPDCMDPAFKILMIDSSGNKLTGFSVMFTNNIMDTITVSDTGSTYSKTDSAYSMYGKGGKYAIKIIHAHYNPILLEGVEATLNSCGINNTRNLKVIPTRKSLAKKGAADYIISEDFVEPGCGS